MPTPGECLERGPGVTDESELRPPRARGVSIGSCDPWDVDGQQPRDITRDGRHVTCVVRCGSAGRGTLRNVEPDVVQGHGRSRLVLLTDHLQTVVVGDCHSTSRYSGS